MKSLEYLSKNEPITLVGGSEVNSIDLFACLKMAPNLVAVDGGANKLRSLNIIPKYIIGDMDSVKNLNYFVDRNAEIIHIPEQQTTDFDKSLRTFYNSKYILALGFMGKSSDHSLAAFSAILKRPKQNIMIVNKYDLVMVLPPKISLKLPIRTKLSVFPFAEIKGLRSKGLKYPLDNINFSPFGMLGVRNETNEEIIEIEVDSTKALLLLPRKHLSVIIDQLF